MEVRLDVMDLENLIKYLSVEKPNLATQRKIAKQIIGKLDSKAIVYYLKVLSQNENWACRILSCYILPSCYQIIKNRKEVEKILFKLADDKDWRVRESTAWSFYKLLLGNFEVMYPLFIDWGKHGNANIRRALIIAVMKMAKHRREEYAKSLLNFIEQFLTDQDKYVQKALIFAIGDGFLRYYPSHTYMYLNSWVKNKEPQVHWIIAMSLCMAEARKHVEECLKILKELSFDSTRRAQNAVIKSLLNLAQNDPEKVLRELQTWKTNQHRKYIVNEVLQKVNEWKKN